MHISFSHLTVHTGVRGPFEGLELKPMATQGLVCFSGKLLYSPYLEEVLHNEGQILLSSHFKIAMEC